MERRATLSGLGALWPIQRNLRCWDEMLSCSLLLPLSWCLTEVIPSEERSHESPQPLLGGDLGRLERCGLDSKLPCASRCLLTFSELHLEFISLP